MNISVFDVVGPVMIGPSSSHTAGAARLARVARHIAAQPFTHVSFGLCGSFARTHKGHGTDRALVAGALGIREDDDRLANSFEIAREVGLGFDFYEAELEGLHENTAVILFTLENGGVCEIIGSSVGGGRIMIHRIDGFDVEFDATLPTLLIHQNDRRGVLSGVTAVLAVGGINIGVMKLSRQGKMAFCIIETDDRISCEIAQKVSDVRDVLNVRIFNPEASNV